ncbi:MAG: LamG domain-containing protein [Candidatus Kapabacteria bacterium]|nr:LamG domain-containing protein [Candidatus Kapabacteria bacterium]MBX7153962.1 LamG domain-containing protein [Bacteroidota bacterium]
MKYIYSFILAVLLLFPIISSAQNFALNFTPTQYISSSPPGPVMLLTNNFTIECWVRWDGTNSAVDKYIFFNGNTSIRGYSLYIKANTQSIQMLYGGVIDLATGVTLPANTPTHLALVRNAGITTLYVNGTAAPNTTTASPNVPIGTDGFSIGYFGSSVSFPGQIDNFRMWGAPLSAATINAWMGLSVITTHPDIASLIANYPMNEGSGQTTVSVGGSNPVSLTLGSTPTTDANDPTWVQSTFPVPTVTEWGLLLMGVLLMALAWWKFPVTRHQQA